MKTEAWCKICGTDVANIATLSFKIDDLAFIIKLYCKKIPNGIMKKQIGVKILKHLVLNSTYISLYDHLTSFIFDKSCGHLVNISENQILISTAIRMRRILNNFKYDHSKNIEDQTKIIYNKIWKPTIKM